MSTLVLHDVPPGLLERLQRRAAANNRPVSVEALQVLDQAMQDLPTEPARGPSPYDLPVPGKSERVSAQDGPMWLPDSPFLTEEIPAPYDLPLRGHYECVTAQDGPMRLPDPVDVDEPE